ncbi:MAG: HtaA domain-containing protein [Actinomycetaceae bacterium]|nr:HtaA domain-containing protein [Actinomycetaceae bacterium]
MRPTVKRTVLSSLVAAALVAGSTLPSFAADSSELPPASPTETVATSSTPEGTEGASSEEQPASAQASETAPAETARTETNDSSAATAGTESAAEVAPGASEATVEKQNTTAEATPAAATVVQVKEAYANWDFRKSFREYVGIENETRSEGLELLEKGGHLLWTPKEGQTFDTAGNKGKLKFKGKVGWTKYDGLLNVQISNLTVDFENRKLLVDGYTAGTMAKAGEVTLNQAELADLSDLQVTKHEGYVVISSLRPVFTEEVKKLVGLYTGEAGAPLVITLTTATSEETTTPKPVLWELFPDRFNNPSTGPVYSDDPIRNVTIKDSKLEECIREQYDVAAGIPITNKVLESLQALKCPAYGIESLEGIEPAINLTSISFKSNKLTSLKPLANATKLQDVNVANNKLVSLDGLQNSPRISILRAAENYLTDVSAIKSMGYIYSIDLSHNRISDLSQLAVKMLDDTQDKLRLLDLSHNRISDLSKINDLPFVRELNLSNNLIENIGELANKLALEKLNLEYNFITDPSALGKWATDPARGVFTELKIRYNKFTDWSSLEALKEGEDLYGGTVNKIRFIPAEGEVNDYVNPASLDEVAAKNEAKDSEIAEEIAALQPKVEAPANVEKQFTASLNWGVRSSFRNYIKNGPAAGSWELLGGVTGEFNFPLKEGQKLDPKAVDKIDFTGSVRFTGHGGLLDLTISAPTVEKVNGKWQLVATLTSKPLNLGSGRPHAATSFRNALDAPRTVRAAVATLSAPTVTPTADGGVTLGFADVRLTAAGADAFAKFYPEGKDLDPVTVSVTVAGTTPANPGTSDPSTPTDPQPGQPNGPVAPNPAIPAFVADLHWGVKSTFRSYISEGVAQGKWELLEGVTGEFVFPLLPNTTIDPRNHDTVNFGGKVHFTGHKGLLDMTIGEPTVQKIDGNWKLIATLTSVPFDKNDIPRVLRGEKIQPGTPVTKRVVLADLLEPKITPQGETRHIHFAKVILTKEGADAFANFYPAGQELDPLTVVLRPANSAATPGTPAPSQPQQPAPAPKPQAPKDTKPAVKHCEIDPTKQRITGGNLAWGVRASFTNYVRGSIANGGWNLAGTSWDGTNFNWGATGGVYNTASRVGTVYYAGSVNFYGHKGVLDLTMSNPTIQINGNSGALYLTVAGSDMKGNKFNLGRVHFANLTFGGVYVNGGRLSFNTTSVVLTDAGAKAFAGFYKAGEVLAPMSTNVALTNATACDPKTGELIEYGAFGATLPATGTQMEGLLLASLLTLLGGATALAAKRRRVK